MPPLSAEIVKVTPKTKAELSVEAALQKRETEARTEAAKVLPLSQKKRGKPTETVKAIYQTDAQQGSKLWTRAWYRRNNISLHEPIEVHTDLVELTTSHARRVPQDDGETMRIQLVIPSSVEGQQIDVDGHTYGDFNTAQKNQVLDSIADTHELIANEVTVQAASHA